MIDLKLGVPYATVTLEAPIDKGVVAVSAKKEKIVVCHCNSLDKK
jgi:hypothetical protein